MDGAPPGSLSACHPSGWMQLDIFSTWFDHFIKFSGATLSNPVLLILDGHATHVRNIDVINKARDSGIVIICLPPHCSHRMQPLDVSFMKPLSSYYNVEIEKWLRNHPGRTVTDFQIAQLITPAYLKAATALVAANGFRKSGIWPVDRDIFDEHEFAPSHPTDIPEKQASAETEQCAATLPLLSAIPAMECPDVDMLISTADHVSGGTNAGDEVLADVESSTHPPAVDSVIPSEAEVSSFSAPSDNQVAMIEIDMEIDDNSGGVSFGESMTVTSDTNTLLPVASSSAESAVNVSAFYGQPSGFVTAAEISPYPKIYERTQRRVSKSSGAAAVLTSSPYKTSLEEYHAKKKKPPKTKASKRQSNTEDVGCKKDRKSTKTKNEKTKDAPVPEVLLEKRPKPRKRAKKKAQTLHPKEKTSGMIQQRT